MGIVANGLVQTFFVSLQLVEHTTNLSMTIWAANSFLSDSVNIFLGLTIKLNSA